MQIRRVVAAAAAVTIASTSLVACSSDDSKSIKVGTTDDAKKAWVAFEQEAKNAGYDIEIQPFADYNTPNQALDQGELDTNNFQHLKFLAEYNHGNDTNLVPIVATEIVPLALFWKDHDSLDGIVRRADRVDGDLADFDRLTCSKEPDVRHRAEVTLDRPKGDRTRIDGQAVPALVNARAGGMVSMVVRQDHGVHPADVAPVGGHPLFSLPAADSGVEQEARSAGFDVEAIAVRA